MFKNARVGLSLFATFVNICELIVEEVFPVIAGQNMNKDLMGACSRSLEKSLCYDYF